MMALIALGGNLPHGDATPQQGQMAAISQMQSLGLRLVGQSRFFRTPAYPAGAGPDYVNCAVRMALPDGMAPQGLLGHLAAIELAHGRQRLQRWGGRTLDLDILACDDMVLPDRAGFCAWAELPPDQAARRVPDQLILPHPRLHERAFVLVPLLDIAPDWRHPVFGHSVRQMHDALPAADRNGVIALPAATKAIICL